MAGTESSTRGGGPNNETHGESLSAEEAVTYVEGLDLGSIQNAKPIRRYLKDIILQAVVPAPWRGVRSRTKGLYYVNDITNESTWQHPLEEGLLKLATTCNVCLQLAEDERDSAVRKFHQEWTDEAQAEMNKWKPATHEGQEYYYNIETNEPRWDDPKPFLHAMYYMMLSAIAYLLDSKYVTNLYDAPAGSARSSVDASKPGTKLSTPTKDMSEDDGMSVASSKRSRQHHRRAVSKEEEEVTGYAGEAKRATFDRGAEASADSWMPDLAVYARDQLGLDATDDIDRKILHIIKPIFSLVLPLPWIAGSSTGTVTFANPAFQPLLEKATHPMATLHAEVVEALRNSLSSRGRIKTSLAKEQMKKLTKRLAGTGSLPEFGNWHNVEASLYEDSASGLRRTDDPKLAAASHVGLSLIALKIVWERVISDNAFPFSDNEIWNTAVQAANAVVRQSEVSQESPLGDPSGGSVEVENAEVTMASENDVEKRNAGLQAAAEARFESEKVAAQEMRERNVVQQNEMLEQRLKIDNLAAENLAMIEKLKEAKMFEQEAEQSQSDDFEKKMKQATQRHLCEIDELRSAVESCKTEAGSVERNLREEMWLAAEQYDDDFKSLQLQQQRDVSDDVIEQLRSEILSLDSQCLQATSAEQHLRGELHSTEEQLEQQGRESESEFQLLRSEVTALDNECSKSVDSMTQQSKLIEELRSSEEEYQAELQSSLTTPGTQLLQDMFESEEKLQAEFESLRSASEVRLQQQRHEHEAEISLLKSQNASQNCEQLQVVNVEVERLSNQLQSASEAHAGEIERIKKQYKEELDQASKSHADEIACLRKELEGDRIEVDRLQQQWDESVAEVSLLRSKFSSADNERLQIANIQAEQLNKELQSASQAHADSIERIRGEYKEELHLASQSHADDIAVLQQQSEGDRVQIDRLQQRLDESVAEVSLLRLKLPSTDNDEDLRAVAGATNVHEIERIKRQHKEELHVASQSHADEIACLRKQFGTEIDKLSEAHKHEITSLREQYRIHQQSATKAHVDDGRGQSQVIRDVVAEVTRTATVAEVEMRAAEEARQKLCRAEEAHDQELALLRNQLQAVSAVAGRRKACEFYDYIRTTRPEKNVYKHVF